MDVRERARLHAHERKRARNGHVQPVGLLQNSPGQRPGLDAPITSQPEGLPQMGNAPYRTRPFRSGLPGLEALATSPTPNVARPSWSGNSGLQALIRGQLASASWSPLYPIPGWAWRRAVMDVRERARIRAHERKRARNGHVQPEGLLQNSPGQRPGLAAPITSQPEGLPQMGNAPCRTRPFRSGLPGLEALATSPTPNVARPSWSGNSGLQALIRGR
jgi:hypothetical protein